MKAVYEATEAIPELDVLPGDRLVVRPGHPTAPLAVVKRYGHHSLVRLMGDGWLDRLTPIHTSPPLTQSPSPARRYPRPSPSRPRHLRAL